MPGPVHNGVGPGVAPLHPSVLVLVHPDDHPDDDGWQAPVQQPLEQRAKLANIKSLGAVKQCDDWNGLVPEEVVGHLVHQPAALSAVGLEAPIALVLVLICILLYCEQINQY